MKKTLFFALCLELTLFSCTNNDKIKSTEPIKINEDSIINSIKNYFIKKYSPIINWENLNLDYTIDYKVFFVDTVKPKLLLVIGKIKDISYFNNHPNLIIKEGNKPRIKFYVDCTENDIKQLLANRNEKDKIKLFVIKIKDFYRPSNSKSYVSHDSLIEYKSTPIVYTDSLDDDY